jgi:replicative DNA helicase
MQPEHHYNLEAEQAVLGGILMRQEAYDDISDILTGEDFYSLQHRLIWRGMVEVIDTGHPCDVITLAEHLDRSGLLDDVGGHAYIGTLYTNTSSAANVRRYAKVVTDYARERRTVAALHGAMVTMEGTGGTDEKLDQVGALVLSAVEAKRSGGEAVRLGGVLLDWVERMETRLKGETAPGIKTGYADFDKMTGGLHGGNLIIIAGRPSMGKSTVAQNICEHVAVVERIPTLFFSMEMTTDEVIARSTASLGRVDSSRMLAGGMVDADWAGVTVGMGRLKDAPFFVDESPALTPADLRSRVRKLKRKEGIGLVAIDYLQLMRAPGYKNDRVHEIEEISRSMKSMAKELGIPVILLSQLNRSVEQRADKRPIMADLRESGAIEQDADVIAFIYRADQYKATDAPDTNIAEMILRKQRNGPTGTVKLVSNLHHYRFDNYDGRPIENPPAPSKRSWSGGMPHFDTDS